MPAELILWALVSFMLRRAEPGGLDTIFSSINDICASKISSARIKTSESCRINPKILICAQNQSCRLHYLNKERNC